MKRRAICIGLTTAALALLAAPVADAATSTFDTATGLLTITGDATAEAYTISSIPGMVTVTVPGTAVAPVGGAPFCGAAASTITCSTGIGGLQSITLNAGDGDDSVTDSRTLAGGTDTINGEAGDDTLAYGGPVALDGAVDLNGGAGNDVLTKNATDPSVALDGGDGDDVLNAEDAAHPAAGALSGSDTGGLGNDTFNGSAQNSDTFLGGPGSDAYHGGTAVPGPGASVDDPAAFQLDFAADDIEYGARTDAQTVTLDGVADDGSAGEDDNVGADVEEVDSGSGNDALTAGVSAAFLFGGAGDDTLVGGPSDDTLSGGAGSDNIVGNDGDDFLVDGDATPFIVDPGDPPQPPAGNDTLNGGAGDDVLLSDVGADNLIGGTGFDRASFSRAIPQASTVLTPEKFAGVNITLDDVANDGVGAAAEGDNVHSDIEEIDTSDGDDVVSGSANAETFSTGGGNDTITPGGGADIVFAGRGNDTINAVDQTTDRIDCGQGADSATVDLPGGQPQRADVTIDCETIAGQAFAALPDTSPTVLKLGGATIVKSRTFRRTGTLPLQVTCSKPCSVSGEAFTSKARAAAVGDLSVGSGTLPLGTGTRTLKVKIGRKFSGTYKRRVKSKAGRKKGLSFSVTVRVSDALGIQAAAKRTIKVKG